MESLLDEKLDARPRMLVVDDDEGTVNSVRLVFDANGYNSVTVSNGRAALEKTAETEFDLALIDIRLPDMGGIDLLKHVKKMHPFTAVIMMTGYSSVDSSVEAMKSGASGYVVKPVDMRELLTAAGEAMARRRIEREKKEAEAALRRSERHLRLAQKIGRMGSWSWDVGTDSFFWSDHVYEMLGYGDKPPAGEAAALFVHPDDRESWISSLVEASENRKPFSINFRGISRDERVLWFHI